MLMMTAIRFIVTLKMKQLWRFLKRGFRRFLSILFATKRRKAKIKAHALPWSTPIIETSDNVDEEEECVIGDMPGMPLGSKEILSESHPMVNECLKLERKHLKIYDVRCGFTIDERSRNKPAIIGELYDTSLNASNLSNIKSHMNNPTHRPNVYAMSGTDVPAET